MNSEASIEKSVSIRRHFHFPAFLVALSSAFFIFGTARLSAAFVLLVQAVIFFLVYVLICRNGVFPKKKASVFEIFYLLLLTLTGYSCQIVSLEELYPSIVQKEAEILPAFPFSVLGVILWLGSMPFLFWGWRWIFSWILPDLKRFFTSFSRAETIFAAVLFLLMFGTVFWTSTQTSFLIAPKTAGSFLENSELMQMRGDAAWNPERILTDVFFGTDTRTFYSFWNFTWLNIFRHPFYGFAWMPFIPLFLLLTLIFHFCGFGVWFYSAGLASALLQIVWWTVTAVMLRRLVKEITDRSFSFAFMVLYALSFPALFVFFPERLILTTATLAAFVYFRYSRQLEPGSATPLATVSATVSATDSATVSATDLTADSAAISTTVSAARLTPADSVWAFAAIGTTLTSALIPVWALWQCRRSFRGFLQEVSRFAVLCTIVFVLLGSCLLDLHYGITQCFRWTPHTSEVQTQPDVQTQTADYAQGSQYLHFLHANIFTPNAEITQDRCDSVSPKEISSRVLYTGGAIGILGLLSGIMYRKSQFVQTAFLWSLTAFILLCVLGFGARFNEMVLYVSYFSWAILPLAVLPFYRLLGNRWNQAALLLFGMAALTFGMNAALFCEILQQMTDTYIIP